jgi:hypothetical protein
MTRTHFLGVLFVIAACDGQAGTDYPGEPLATIHGTIVNNVTVSSPVEVMLWWIPNDDNISPKFVGQRVAVSGEFPAAFTLDLFEPPPAGSYRFSGSAYGLPDFGQAAIVAAPPGFSFDGPPPAVFATSEVHQVMYLSSAVVAGTPAAELFGGPIAAGYHVTPFCTDESDELPACLRPLPDDLDTEIVLVLERGP